MADVGRITELWRAAADALELPGVVAGTVPSQWLLDEKRRRQRAEAECGRLREQLDQWKAKAFDALAALKQANDNTEAAEAECGRLREQLDAARQALKQIVASSPNTFQARDIARAALGVEGRDE